MPSYSSARLALMWSRWDGIERRISPSASGLVRDRRRENE